MGYYVLNKETLKIELHFDKAEYMALSEDQKKSIKSNFLFSRYAGAWVSRAKFPNTYRAEQTAQALGLENKGKTGEALTFAEQMERKAEKAERRAERYEARSAKAEERGDALQKPIENMRGDIAFFTQPNINTSAGRAFTNRRNKMFAAFEKGFDEFKKSEYYAERAEVARRTAAQTKPTDKGFINRRIKEADKTIRAQKRNIAEYNKQLEEVKAGKIMKRLDGSTLTESDIMGWIENAEMIIENAISKSIYYHECMEELGGVAYSYDNINIGDIVIIKPWGKCEVIGKGKVNITYKILSIGGTGIKAAYAEIENVVRRL